MYPEKVIRINLKRLYLPKVFELIVLGIVLYIAIWINYVLLYKTMPIEVKLLLILAILVIICIDAILNYLRFAKYSYLIYGDRIEFVGKKNFSLSFNEIVSIGFQTDFYDRLFKTGKIRLNDKLIEHISDVDTTFFYIQDLMKQKRKNP